MPKLRLGLAVSVVAIFLVFFKSIPVVATLAMLVAASLLEWLFAPVRLARENR